MELDDLRDNFNADFSGGIIFTPGDYSFLGLTLAVKRATRQDQKYLMAYPVTGKILGLAWIDLIIDPINEGKWINIPLPDYYVNFLGISDPAYVSIKKGMFNNVEIWNPNRLGTN